MSSEQKASIEQQAREKWEKMRRDLPPSFGSDTENPEIGYIGGYYNGFCENSEDMVEDPSLNRSKAYKEAWHLGYKDGRGDRNDS